MMALDLLLKETIDATPLFSLRTLLMQTEKRGAHDTTRNGKGKKMIKLNTFRNIARVWKKMIGMMSLKAI